MKPNSRKTLVIELSKTVVELDAELEGAAKESEELALELSSAQDDIVTLHTKKTVLQKINDRQALSINELENAKQAKQDLLVERQAQIVGLEDAAKRVKTDAKLILYDQTEEIKALKQHIRKIKKAKRSLIDKLKESSK